MKAEAHEAASRTLFADVQVVEADRLKFSGWPSFNPAPLLDAETRQWYEDPLGCSIAPEDCEVDPPHVTVRGKRAEILKLLEALDKTGRLALFSPEQVRMSHRAGVFCLMKNLTTDRLIHDSRPANTLELPLNGYIQTMASVNPLLDLVLEPGEVVVSAGEDLKDFYYSFKVSPSRAARNALAVELEPAEAKRFAAFQHVDPRAAKYVPALRTMAMGDVNAVKYGQQAHMALALRMGLRFERHAHTSWACPAAESDGWDRD